MSWDDHDDARRCANCGRIWYPDHHGSKYCTDTCRREGKQKQEAARRTRTNGETARPLGRPFRCAYCNATSVRTWRNQSYCNERCRLRAKAKRARVMRRHADQ